MAIFTKLCSIGFIRVNYGIQRFLMGISILYPFIFFIYSCLSMKRIG